MPRGGIREGAGRKALDPNKAITKKCSITLSNEEHEKIKKAAEKANKTFSRFLVETTINNLD